MKENSSLAEIAQVLRSRRRFLVMSHLRPDGDAIGCLVAMGHALRNLGHDVTLWNQDGVPDKLAFLPGAEWVARPPATPQAFDVAIALDTAVQNRLGTALEAISQADVWVNIDHHISNNHYGDLAYVDSAAPAAGQILAEFFLQERFPITEAMAANLYAALSTDTGSFQYPNTSARTYQIAAELIQAGARVGELSQRLYESYPRRRLELLREVLSVARFSADGRAASFGLSLATAQALRIQPEDTEGLIDTIRAVQGVVVAAFFEELPEGKVRISLRSKDPRADVCRVCQHYGGGGHVLASGARAAGSLEEVEGRVLGTIEEMLSAVPA